jgi:4-amino-4-deoxy-L-arabinose transferase-like glycosyltransferase
MSFANAFRRVLAPADRLVAALTDPARRERTAALVLVAYAAVWALYGAFAKGSQDLHYDMGEVVGWSRELDWGYAKHPPLAAWLVRAWFTVFPLADWSYYLFAMAIATLGLWIAWRLAEDYLDAEKRVLGLALLTFIPFFNFHALKFNANAVLIPVWAATTWWFLRSFETRSVNYAALAGLAAGAAMLGKYWSVMLLAGLAIAALADPRRREYFRSAAPWVTVAAGAIVLAPHAIWLAAGGFEPFWYAGVSHATQSRWEALGSGLGYIGGALGYAAVPILVALAVTLPGRAALADTAWPTEPARRTVLLAFILPIVLPAVAAIAARSEVVSIWAMPAMTLLPVVLLSSPLVKFPRRALVNVTAIAVAFPLLLALVSPVIAYVIHQRGVPKSQEHYQQLAAAIDKAWHDATGKPLRFVGGDPVLAFGTVFYLADRPRVFAEFDDRAKPATDPAEVARDGIAMACMAADRVCAAMLRPREATSGAVHRSEVEIVRRYLGVNGPPQRYLIVIVPPK